LRILTVNTGSTSLKLERYDLSGTLPAIAAPPDAAFSAEPATDAAEQALRDAMREPIDAVAHRFVQLPVDAPAVTPLDAAAIARIGAAGADDPLHDAAALRAVELVRAVLPDVPQFAISDSTFHRTMPPAATTYALPREITGTTLHRIGYHGLSHEYAAHRGCALAGLDVRHARVITAHLGGGSSLCAVRDGASIDTTMGYTSLEGVPMATRSGSVDPGLLLHLLRGGMTPAALDDMLEHRSGLLGISGLSGDTRELLAAQDHPGAQLALDVLAWRLRAALGALIAVLGGADAIVFTGGIGEHAPSIRGAALAGGLGSGVTIDADLNARVHEGRISPAGSVTVIVVGAREGWQLARAIRMFSGTPAEE
jgi:acetate kinase